MCALAVVLGVRLLAVLGASKLPPSPLTSPSPSPAGVSDQPVILFLVDNSASLPPLDPEEKRVVALEKLFTFLQGQRYRLILFAGRRDIVVDDVTHYNNRGAWTDFYYAFKKAQELIETYPPKTEFRIILLTDGLIDPGPDDWEDLPKDQDLKDYAGRKTVDLVRSMRVPLYVILVGEVEGVARGAKEQAPPVIWDMVRAANGVRATSLAQSVSSFFNDNGFLVKKFIFRVAPNDGLKKVEPVVRRIVSPAQSRVELQFLTFLILPLFLFLFLLLGLLVRSFPGPGDLEIVEMSKDVPVHVGADRLHKVESGGWGSRGLSLVPDAKEATATFTYQAPPIDLSGQGLDTSGLDPHTLRLLALGPDELKRALDHASEHGTKEEKIYALNLDYMAKNFEPKEAERVLTASLVERRRIQGLDYLRAKVHLLSNDELRHRLTDSRVHMVAYGKEGERRDLSPGNPARVGPYGFVVKEVARGGRKDVRLVLYYDRVPSLLGLKTILPDFFQRFFRFRRSSQRIVS
jgi:hypothetical protein